jgi:hypothetical protein
MKKTEAVEGTPDFSFPEERKGAARAYVEETGLISSWDAPLSTPKPAPVSEEIFLEKIEKANRLHKRFVSTIKKGALIAFEIGKLLVEWWGKLGPVDSWPQWCQEHLIFDVKTANKYLRIYNNYKDNSKALAGQTITAALKSLSAPKREALEEAEPEAADRQPELPWEPYFELPPLSREVKLNNYRFEIPNSREVYLIQRGLNYPVKIAEVLFPEDKRLKTARRGMLEDVQAVLERYCQEVERIESLEVKR